MTSVNGGTYAGHNPCDGWVDNLTHTINNHDFFLIQGHNLKKYTNDYLQDKTWIL